MCKVIVTDEDGLYETCLATSKETPHTIMKHYKIKPETKDVYVNGTKLSEKNLDKPLPENGMFHLAIRNKTTTRI